MKLKKAEEEGRRRQGTGPERKQAWYCLGTHPMYSRAPVVLLDLGEGRGAGDVWTLAQASPKVDECTRGVVSCCANAVLKSLLYIASQFLQSVESEEGCGKANKRGGCCS